MLLAGCSQPPAARPPMPQPGATAPKLTLEGIGQNSFGTAYRAASKKGNTVDFTLAAVEDGTPSEKYRRAVIMAATSLPTVMRLEPDVQSMRYTVVDPKAPTHKLAVFTVTKDSARSLGGHGSPDALIPLVKVEFADPEYKAATQQKAVQ